MHQLLVVLVQHDCTKLPMRH